MNALQQWPEGMNSGPAGRVLMNLSFVSDEEYGR